MDFIFTLFFTGLETIFSSIRYFYNATFYALSYYPYLLYILFLAGKFVVILLPLLIAIAYTTLIERKVISFLQRRIGPNEVGFYGLLQPLADGVKLILKESILPTHANILIFILAPLITFLLSLITWSIIPFQKGVVYADINLGILFLFAVSSLGVYGIIMSGWSSNSKYPLLGALRSAAQMVSYEVSIGLILISVIICVGSVNLSRIVLSQYYLGSFFFLLGPSAVMFFVSSLAETNRTPFDLPEAEAELVSGYNVEYSAVGFAMFFLGEYSHIILMSTLYVILFFGGWTISPILFFYNTFLFDFYLYLETFSFAYKVVLLVVSFVYVRALVPRYRYDQLMRIGWKVFLPFSFAWLLFVAGLLFCCNYVSFL